MKRVLVALSIASVFAACSGKQNETVVVIDTTSIKQRAVQDEQARVKAEKEEQARIAAARRSAARTSPTYSTPAVGSSAAPVASGSGSAVQEKQGMKSSTKGALIGAGAGAIAGGIIGKNVKGAVIGGVVGAGTGYVIGRSKDKKAGRVN
jgi:hypothetical protein